MIYEVFAYFDSKATLFSQPFYAVNSASAKRQAVDQASNLETVIGRHPADFTLFKLGTFDDILGRFDCPRPENLGVVVTLLPPKPGAGFFAEVDK